MKRIALFLVLLLSGCYTQYTITEPVEREVVLRKDDYRRPYYYQTYPYSIYRWEYSRYYPYTRYYVVPEYKFQYIHTSPKPSVPQTRRTSGVGAVEVNRRNGTPTNRRVETVERRVERTEAPTGRREVVRNDSERTERRRVERKVD
jgi:hypothetical protein